MISTARAILSLCPTAKFTMNGDDYDQLLWHSEDITKPTLSEVNAKISELEVAEPMRLLRMERDRLLIKSDWTQGDDVPVGIKTNYTTYRQKLRDLPSISTPIIDTLSPTGISSVTWPTEPS
tara:strand:- start:324 stop:689 length:366 start_codon:yes stop_codon:yes gene_type:complete